MVYLPFTLDYLPKCARTQTALVATGLYTEVPFLSARKSSSGGGSKVFRIFFDGDTVLSCDGLWYH